MQVMPLQQNMAQQQQIRNLMAQMQQKPQQVQQQGMVNYGQNMF